jgi:hypothetical protein
MLHQMYRELPGISRDTVLENYGDIKDLRTEYDFMDSIRHGSIRAYAVVNGRIAITLIVLCSVGLTATFFMPDYYLGRQQNAVINKGLGGELVNVTEHQAEKEEVDPSRSRSIRLRQKLLGLYRK